MVSEKWRDRRRNEGEGRIYCFLRLASDSLNASMRSSFWSRRCECEVCVFTS